MQAQFKSLELSDTIELQFKSVINNWPRKLMSDDEKYFSQPAEKESLPNSCLKVARQQKKARLSKVLRENLKKRKVQTRNRAGTQKKI